VNARMATADHDRQWQAAHRQYKSRTVVEFASGKSMHIKLTLIIDRINVTTLMEQQRVTNSVVIHGLCDKTNQQCIAHSGSPPQ